jgi:putative endonuclease
MRKAGFEHRAAEEERSSERSSHSEILRKLRMTVEFLFPPRRIPIAKLGAMGERRAAWFYRLRGYSILERNARLPAGEIDLVVKRGATVVIVEVKTRQTDVGGEGHEAVDRRKRERLIRLGDQYVVKHPEAQLRYDILSIRWTGYRFIVTHYADAFRPVADPRYPWRWRA